MHAYTRKTERRAFTLVELLVVITIISLLAGLLLPALEKAKDAAVKAGCLSDRRQLHILLAQFTDDHEGVFPHAVPDWEAGNREMDDWGAYYGQSTSMYFGQYYNAVFQTLFDDDRDVIGIGALATMRYVEDPRLFWCPAFVRPPKDYTATGTWVEWIATPTSPYRWYYDTAEYRNYWERATDGDDDVGDWALYSGVAHYLYVGNHASGTDGDLPTLERVIADWNTTAASPLLLSCANLSTPVLGETWTYGTAHRMEGVNGVFYDGSGRWIPRSEVKAAGWMISGWGHAGEGDWLSNYNAGTYTSNMGKWARFHATPGRP